MRLAAVLLVAKLCAAQALGPCGEVPITQWSGQKSLRKEILKTPVGMVIIQHTVFGPCVSDSECQDVLKMIRKFHINTRKFDDIGNSFYVGANGRVYEGAGWRVGAHTKGFNYRSIGLSFVGDFRKVLPTPAALQAAQDFISCGVARGFLGKDYQLVGHSQVSQTESPGAYLQNRIRSWPHWSAKPKYIGSKTVVFL